MRLFRERDGFTRGETLYMRVFFSIVFSLFLFIFSYRVYSTPPRLVTVCASKLRVYVCVCTCVLCVIIKDKTDAEQMITFPAEHDIMMETRSNRSTQVALSICIYMYTVYNCVCDYPIITVHSFICCHNARARSLRPSIFIYIYIL